MVDLGVDPLYNAMHVEGMTALAPDNGAIVAWHFAVRAAAVKRQPAQDRVQSALISKRG